MEDVAAVRLGAGGGVADSAAVSREDFGGGFADAGARTDRRNRHGLTPLCLAASKGHSQAVVIIAHNLSKKAINAYCGGYTALHWCCVTGIDAACGFLAKKGADAALRAEPDGETCLYKAATYCHSPCVDILLDAGADANATNSDGAVSYTHLTLPTKA